MGFSSSIEHLIGNFYYYGFWGFFFFLWGGVGRFTLDFKMLHRLDNLLFTIQMQFSPKLHIIVKQLIGA
jgi:hypothetical protein